MNKSDKRKQSFYFPAEDLAAIHRHAQRLDRSLSWIVQVAWRAGQHHVASIPSVSRNYGQPIAVTGPAPDGESDPQT